MTRIILILAFMVSMPVMAGTYRYSVRPIEIVNKVFVDTIHIKVLKDRVYIPVKVGGREYWFLFDTGSGMGIISEKSGIKPVVELGTHTSIDYNGKKNTETVVELPEIKLGSTKIRHYPVDYRKRDNGNEVRNRRKINDALGFALINKGLIIKIDVKAGILIITDKKHFFDKERGYAVNYELRQSVPHVTIEPFDGKRESALFDTGNPKFFALSYECFERLYERDESVREQVEHIGKEPLIGGVHGSGDSCMVAKLRLRQYRFGGFCFNDVEAKTKLGVSNIGCGLLQKGTVIINPFKKRIIFQPY